MKEKVALEEDIEVQNDLKTEHLKQYKVLLLNDDYTSMDFVVDILVEIFHHPLDKAVNLMLDIHKKGRAVCGIYPYEIAETKIHLVTKRARENQYPLKAIMEEV